MISKRFLTNIFYTSQRSFSKVQTSSFFNRSSNQIINGTKPKVIEIITQEDKMTLGQYILRRPFRSYFKMASITFGICFLSNLGTSFICQKRQNFMLNHPDLFTLTLLSKSFQFGLIWPSFYIKAIVRPREVFLLGGGVESIIRR